MPNNNNKNIIIISLGGSLIVPEEIDWQFVRKFKALIEKQTRKGNKFIIITGGGKTARKYQEASTRVTKLTSDDRDWIGIHATRLNAHFVRTIFRKDAHPEINMNPHKIKKFLGFPENILVASGWRPGFSTDYDAVVLAKQFKVKKIINLSNIEYVYNKDPRKFKDAQIVKNISWKDFRKIVGNKWDPGMNAPFDPIASKIAEENKIEVIIANGKDLKNVKKIFENKQFKGTVIS
jgi:uridylate kinase